VIDPSLLRPGHQFPTARIRLDREAVTAYRQAVEDGSPVYRGSDLAPPMAVAAFALRELLKSLELRPGAVHAGQELEFQRPCRIGEALNFQGTLVQNATRGGWRFLVVDLRVTGDGGAPVLAGRSTVLAPWEER